MRLFAEVRARFRALLHLEQLTRDADEEFRFHVDMQAEQLVREGFTPDEARRRALTRFGGVPRTRDEVGDARGVRWLQDFAFDVRYGWRQLRHSPGFAAVAVLTLALGIGANTAIVSVVNGVLLRPLPFADAGRLVMLWETDRHSGTTREPGSWPDYLDYQRTARSLAGLDAITGAAVNLGADGAGDESVRLSAMEVTHGFFDLVGIRPIMGRPFSAEEDRPGALRVVMLGESLWRGRYLADPAIVGRTIRLDDVPHVVIGVLPADADFGLDQVHARASYHSTYLSDGDVDVWLPARASESSYPRDTHPFLLMGRLAPGTSDDAAQRELASLAAGLERAYGADHDRGVHVESLTQVVFGPVRPVLLLLLGSVGLVLLVACVNVANLLLARSAVRVREVAVRGALGAGIGRLARQFVVESMLLALMGGAAGIVVAFAGLRALLALAPADIPRVSRVGIDAPVLGVTLAVSLGVGLVFGLVPTVRALRLDLIGILRGEGPAASGGRGRRRFRDGLIVAELALSVMLVVCAGLAVRSFWSVLRVDPGFRSAGVLKAEYQLPASRYPQDYSKWPAWSEIHGFNGELLRRLRALPGVDAAAIASAHPLDAGFTNSFTVVGREEEARDWPEISVRIVSAGYFATLGVRLSRGRVIEESDALAATPVAVINDAAAARFFPGGDPIGHEIRFWGVSRRIVGVVGNERLRGLTESAPSAVYISLAQVPSASGVVLVRTTRDPLSLALPVRRAVRGVDPSLAVYGVEALPETLLQSVGQRRFAMLVLSAFAAVTLVLALIGVHGVLSYTTSQRTHEIGIRVALGATGGRVAGLVVRGGLALAAWGTALGMAGALAGSRLLTGLLYGVGRLDPWTFIAVPVVVLAASTLATWLPARRASRVDPVEALRAE
jgi:predicted permease